MQITQTRHHQAQPSVNNETNAALTAAIQIHISCSAPLAVTAAGSAGPASKPASTRMRAAAFGFAVSIVLKAAGSGFFEQLALKH